MIFYLLDYPDQHNGNIVGLARRSIRWHFEMIQQSAIEIADKLGSETKCGVPKCPLPVQPEITFLDTVGAVCNEGVEMEHCVATYARDAVYGVCLLFHVEHAGEAATVQLNPKGEIVQTTGRRNKSNDAAKWGATKLTAWGKNMPPPTKSNGFALQSHGNAPF